MTISEADYLGGALFLGYNGFLRNMDLPPPMRLRCVLSKAALQQVNNCVARLVRVRCSMANLCGLRIISQKLRSKKMRCNICTATDNMSHCKKCCFHAVVCRFQARTFRHRRLTMSSVSWKSLEHLYGMVYLLSHTGGLPKIGRTPKVSYSPRGVLGTFWRLPSQNPFWEPAFSEPFCLP